MENEAYLSKQIITYIGNKRKLLNNIGEQVEVVKKKLGKDKLKFMDVFSGSGIVSRYMKQHSSFIAANDIEEYSRIINECYLRNKSEKLEDIIHEKMEQCSTFNGEEHNNIISKYYSPDDDKNIKAGERCFYTNENAAIIDSYMGNILAADLTDKERCCLVAPLLAEASVHVNTSGIFKGFYKNKNGVGQFGGQGKNALKRILSPISVEHPVISDYECDYKIFKDDAINAVSQVGELDLAYLDPPYNQHPYGSNYFMLNVIANYQEPKDISAVSGIPADWNRSAYNNKQKTFEELERVIDACPAKYILLSYNSDGFIYYNDFLAMLSKKGFVSSREMRYNTFRGCRNLNGRDIHVKEFLFLLEKN